LRAGIPGSGEISVAGMHDDAIHDFVEGSARPVANEALKFIERGDAAGQIFEAGLVSLVVGNVFDGGIAARALLNEQGKIFHGDFLIAADIDHLAYGALFDDETEDGFDDIMP
jgi:hypothetical protein